MPNNAGMLAGRRGYTVEPQDSPQPEGTPLVEGICEETRMPQSMALPDVHRDIHTTPRPRE